MVARLKDFIRAIRACKTAADERGVIQKESASIRTSFKEDTTIEARNQNIAKLLYIHMLNYPAHFGQMECLKLVAGGKFPDKRLGYLGIMLLLDENQELMTLATNSLKNDMNQANMYIVGLALCTLGNIASKEMARDLQPEVEKLLGSTNSYIKKKAALCAVKILQKVPDLVDQFIPKAKAMVNEKNHAVLLTGMSLIYHICSINEECVREFRPMVPHLTKHLKSLIATGSSPEHDVSGINDPFLQVRILRLLRILGKGDKEASEAMNDVLAQVATNTDGGKNVGNSILYETCLTIMDIEADSGLRVLAINILGRFLANTDNNVRYVALNTLAKTITIDVNAVQRHRQTVIECLRDGDISIRRRALDLSFSLINESNIRVMMREILLFLEVADDEFKVVMPAKICQVAEWFAPNKRWHIDTILQAGNYIKEEVLSNFIKLIASVPELHAYTTFKLFNLLSLDLSQESLVILGVWCIGEYGNLLFQAPSAAPFEDPEDKSDSSVPMREVKPEEVLSLLYQILIGVYNTDTLTEYVLTTLVKLTNRGLKAEYVEKIKELIRTYTTNIDLEIQQRSVEYYTLLSNPSLESHRATVLDKVVVPAPNVTEKRIDAGAKASVSVSPNPVAAKPSSGGGLLDDLLGLDAAPAPVVPSGGNALDLLGGMFGGLSTNPSPPAATAPATKNDIMGLFNLGSSSTSVGAPANSNPLAGLSGLNSNPLAGLSSTGSNPLAGLSSTGSNPLTGLSSTGSSPLSGLTSTGSSSGAAFAGLGNLTSPALSQSSPPQNIVQPTGAPTVYEKNGLSIVFRHMMEPAQDPNARIVAIQASFTNSGNSPISDLNFQVAVPKTLRLQLLPPSATVVPPNKSATITQVCKILNPTGATPEGKAVGLRLRLKVAYKSGSGENVDEIVEFNGFGANWSW